jgi:hypothetical protein
VKKIQDFKQDFMPSCLPDEVIQSRMYRLGAGVTHDMFQSELRKRVQTVAPQFIQEQMMAAGYGTHP